MTMLPDTVSPELALGTLTAAEAEWFAECERVIEEGRRGFLEVGRALLDIQEERLYRRTHTTFEAYLAERWDIKRSTGYQYMAAARTIEGLSAMADTPLPETERQARPLTTLPPDQQPDAWGEAVEAAGGQQPTAQQVQAAVDKRRPKRPPRAAPPEQPSASEAAFLAAAAAQGSADGTPEQDEDGPSAIERAADALFATEPPCPECVRLRAAYEATIRDWQARHEEHLHRVAELEAEIALLTRGRDTALALAADRAALAADALDNLHAMEARAAASYTAADPVPLMLTAPPRLAKGVVIRNRAKPNRDYIVGEPAPGGWWLWRCKEHHVVSERAIREQFDILPQEASHA